MARKLAIVLRGAPGTGKTTLSNTLRQHFGLLKASHAKLDDGWGQGEKRFAGRDRYGDLRGQPDVLLIELGYGEPLGESFAGATKNPREWLSVIENDGRAVVFFVLDIDRPECLYRVAARGDLSPRYAEIAWERYAPGGICSSQAFSSRSGYDRHKAK
jgi:hypothetical protein